MAKYTTQLRSIVTSLAGETEQQVYANIDSTIAKALPKIFDFDFPIYDESYRNILEAKILRHYWMREIGLESYGLWKLHLSNRLREIMPYYNQLYKSALLDFNPLYVTDITRKGFRNGSENKTNTGTVTDEAKNQQDSETTQDGSNKDYYQETPQGAITDLATSDHLTDIRNINTTNNASVSTNGTASNTRTDDLAQQSINEEEYFEQIQGRQNGASPSKLIKEFRETMLNIDMMIIRDLSDLFYLLY